MVVREKGAYWERGRLGYKPNSVRMLSARDSYLLSQARHQIRQAKVINENGQFYLRRVTDLSKLVVFLGCDLWQVSYRHEDDAPVFEPDGGAPRAPKD